MKYSRPDGDCFISAFKVEYWITGSLRGKFLKYKEQLQFQQVFLEISGLLKLAVGWKMCISLQLLKKLINIRCSFINTASCNEQHALYGIVLI